MLNHTIAVSEWRVLRIMRGEEAKEMRCPTGDSSITLQAKAESIFSDDPGLRIGTSMTLR
jgi:hypothetical protein